VARRTPRTRWRFANAIAIRPTARDADFAGASHRTKEILVHGTVRIIIETIAGLSQNRIHALTSIQNLRRPIRNSAGPARIASIDSRIGRFTTQMRHSSNGTPRQRGQSEPHHQKHNERKQLSHYDLHGYDSVDRTRY
jgi:hypothetical protein